MMHETGQATRVIAGLEPAIHFFDLEEYRKVNDMEPWIKCRGDEGITGAMT